jgi:hypothetical protein
MPTHDDRNPSLVSTASVNHVMSALRANPRADRVMDGNDWALVFDDYARVHGLSATDMTEYLGLMRTLVPTLLSEIETQRT